MSPHLFSLLNKARRLNARSANTRVMNNIVKICTAMRFMLLPRSWKISSKNMYPILAKFANDLYFWMLYKSSVTSLPFAFIFPYPVFGSRAKLSNFFYLSLYVLNNKPANNPVNRNIIIGLPIPVLAINPRKNAFRKFNTISKKSILLFYVLEILSMSNYL